MTPNVIDIYHGDKVSSLEALKQAGIWGIIHKSSQGTAMVDGSYGGRRQWVSEAGGLLWGAYHFLTAADVKVQARHFLESAAPDVRTLMAVDFEPSNSTPSLDQCRQFIELVEAELGRKLVLYSGNLIKEKLGTTGDSWWGARRLWLAQYGPKPTHVPSCWGVPWLWQFSETGNVPGVIGNCDVNTYTRDQAHLIIEWADGGPNAA